MYATAIVRGKVVRFRLPEALSRAQKRFAGKSMTAQEAIDFVEEKRRELDLRKTYPSHAMALTPRAALR